jgi:hypothetical protein
MRRLVLILLTFIAVLTFIRAFGSVDEIGRTSIAENERPSKP